MTEVADTAAAGTADAGRVELPGGWYFVQVNPPDGVLYALRTPKGRGFGINGTGMSMGLAPVRAFAASLSPAPAGGGAAGHVLVPVEPTPEMLGAGNRRMCDWFCNPSEKGRTNPWDRWRAIWAAMIAAAPQPLAAPEGPVDGLVDGIERLTAVYSSAVMAYWCDSTLEHQDKDKAHLMGLRAIAENWPATPPQGAGVGLAGVEAARWIDQTRTRDTHPDVHGDCTRAAIASLFALPLKAVPDFDADDPVAFYESIEAFFLSLGFELYRVDRDVAFDALHLASGPAARGVSHTVVRRGAEIVHDPHPSRAGLLSIEFVVVPVLLDPAIRTAAALGRPSPVHAQALDSDVDSEAERSTDRIVEAVTSGFRADVARIMADYAASSRDARQRDAALGRGAGAGVTEERYVVWSNEHAAWWGPDECGYRSDLARAGRYSREHALKLARARDGQYWVNARLSNPPEIAIREDDALAMVGSRIAAEDRAPDRGAQGGEGAK